MGIHDRDYYRDDEPGFHLGGGSSMTMVTKIVIVTGVCYLANMMLGTRQDPHWVWRWMSLHISSMDEPWMWWQFLTSGFAHNPQDIRHLLFNMAGLWFLGREVERVLGRYELLRFYLISMVAGSALWGLRNYFQYGPDAAGSLSGASGAVTAVVMLFVFYFPKRTILLMMVIPMPAWVLGVLIIVMNLFGNAGVSAAGGDARVAYDVHLVGAAFAAAYHYLAWNFGRMLPEGGSAKRWFRRGPKLKVHRPKDKNSPQMDAEADRILEKLHREGEDSLTTKERRTLEAYSRRMRQKHS